MDADWFSTYGTQDKSLPNGVLRDGRQSGTLTKKHVTISPRSDSFSSGYMSGRQGDYNQKNLKSPKSGPSSVSSDMSTLASFAYLHDPSLATPYSSLGPKRQTQQTTGNVHNIPVHVQDGYGSVPRGAEMGRTAQVRPYYTDQNVSPRSNAPPVRRHSDDDYDNAGDMTAMLPHQAFYPQQPSPWQQPEMSPWRMQETAHYSHQWQQPPPQQTVWQYQSTGSQQNQQQQQQQQPHHLPPLPPQQHNYRQNRPVNEDVPVAQPLVRPSQRRPMTFEQISSSKVSLYDNIHMNRPDDEEE